MSVQRNIRKPLLALLATCTLGGVIFVLLLSFAGVTVKPRPTYRFDAIVPDAIRLVDFADVRQAGVRIGKVTAIVPSGKHIRLRMEIERRYGPVYDNATLLIRGKSLAGENYVDLRPGGPPGHALRPGATLPISRSPESTQLDQVISILKPSRVRDLRRIVQALGTGLRARGGELSQFIGANSSTTTDSYDVIQAVARERLALTQLIGDFGHVAQALSERGRELRALVRGARRLSLVFASRQARMSETLAAAPAFLRTARESIRRLTTLSGVATPVLADTRVALNRLAPAVDRLGPAASASRDAITQLGAFSRRASPLLTALGRFAPVATRFMDPLERNLRELNPIAAYMRPYARDSAVAVALIGATAKARDATSHAWRIQTLVTSKAAAGLSPAERAALDALIATGVLGEHAGSIGKNPYPPPGPLKKVPSFTGAYPRVEADPPYRRR